MGDVIDLRQHRIERLANDLARRLRDSDGRVSEKVGDLPVAVDTWRAAGRRAGRLLGWSVRTRVRDGRVSLVDNRRNRERSQASRSTDEVAHPPTGGGRRGFRDPDNRC